MIPGEGGRGSECSIATTPAASYDSHGEATERLFLGKAPASTRHGQDMVALEDFVHIEARLAHAERSNQVLRSQLAAQQAEMDRLQALASSPGCSAAAPASASLSGDMDECESKLHAANAELRVAHRRAQHGNAVMARLLRGLEDWIGRLVCARGAAQQEGGEGERVVRVPMQVVQDKRAEVQWLRNQSHAYQSGKRLVQLRTRVKQLEAERDEAHGQGLRLEDRLKEEAARSRRLSRMVDMARQQQRATMGGGGGQAGDGVEDGREDCQDMETETGCGEAAWGGKRRREGGGEAAAADGLEGGEGCVDDCKLPVAEEGDEQMDGVGGGKRSRGWAAADPQRWSVGGGLDVSCSGQEGAMEGVTELYRSCGTGQW